MRDDLKTIIQEVKRNEALIEFMELKGLLPEHMRSIGEITQSILETLQEEETCYES